MAEAWPFAHTYWEVVRTACSGCGRRRQCVVVYDDTGLLSGCVTFCWPCLRADGDPLARMR